MSWNTRGGGIYEDTGMLILLTGYGASITSRVFQKMQEEFSNLYNMVVIRIDYYGSKYMGREMLADVYAKLEEAWELPPGRYVLEIETGETREEFNDMGIMQALDIVNATLSAIRYLQRKYRGINTKKVILFGSSHGAYLAHLANLICPGLYAAMVDISAYLRPYYLDHSRELVIKCGETGVRIHMEYFLQLHPEYRYHESLYDLRFLYKNKKNTCKILAFHGREDEMVDFRERELFIGALDNAELVLIEEEDVDGILCGNADHGLGMDFFELFRIVMPMLNSILREQSTEVELEKEVVLGDTEAFVRISYEGDLPRLEDITF